MPITFNPAQVDTSAAGGFPPIPKGWYQAFIVEVDEQPTKANNGRWVMLKLQIVGGNYDGRLIWHYMCYNHVNVDTQNKAQAHLAMACQATGIQSDQAGNLDPFAMSGKMLEFSGKCDADGNSNVFEYRAVQQQYAQQASASQPMNQAAQMEALHGQASAPAHNNQDDDIPFP